MKIKVSDLRKKFIEINRLVVDDDSVAEWVADLNLDYDLTNNLFSGLDHEIKFAKSKITIKPHTIEVNKPGLKLVNCNNTPAYITMKDLMPQAIAWAKDQGQVFVGIKNGGYSEALGTIARMFAEQDLLCIYSSSGGPQGVVPFGGKKDILGTNPLSYAIPTSKSPIIFDGATAQFAYGTIAKAKKTGKTLPDKTYLDENGDYTTDANDAIAIIPFGGYKGYAINLLLEVMTTALVGGKAGLLQNDNSGLGAFMLLIDPSALGKIQDFKRQVDKLIDDINDVPPAEGFDEVRVPGLKSQKLRQQQLINDMVEVDEKTYENFLKEYKKLVK